MARVGEKRNGRNVEGTMDILREYLFGSISLCLTLSAMCKYESDRGVAVLECLPSILRGVKVEGKLHTADGYMQMLLDFPTSTVPEG